MTGFGWDPTHSIVKARQEGLQTVLYKPFRADRLMEAVEQALRASPADRFASATSQDGKRDLHSATLPSATTTTSSPPPPGSPKDAHAAPGSVTSHEAADSPIEASPHES